MRALTLSPFGLGAAFDYRGDDTSPRRLLRSFIDQRSYRWRSIGFVNPFYWSDSDGDLRPPNATFRGETHALELSRGYDDLFTRAFKGATRTCIRRSEHEGVQVKVASHPSQVRDYFLVHRALAHAKGGYADLYPESVFATLVQSCRRAQVLVATSGEKVIGGGVFLDDGPTVFYWHAAADRNFSSFQPAYAVLSFAIRDAISKGKTWLNFGASQGIDSLRRFKESWGAIPISQRSVTYRNPMLRVIRGLAGR
jgi:hypothetical protein